MEIHIDFETYSDCDLRKEGAWNYSRHPSTRVLCAAISVGVQPPTLYFSQSDITGVVNQYFKEGHTFYAWNSFFECCIINNTLDLGGIVHFEKWNDIMSWAAAASLPQGLGQCAQVFFPKNTELQKDKIGGSLINKLCKPQRASWLQLSRSELWMSENPEAAALITKALELKQLTTKIKDTAQKIVEVERYKALVSQYDGITVAPIYKHYDYEELLQQMGQYCVQDVIVERELSKLIRPLSEEEKRVWVQDQKINWRGVKCDTLFCENATSIFENAKIEKQKAMQQETGLANPNSTAQLLPWLQATGLEISNLQAATVRECLLEPELTEAARRVLTHRSSSARTPPKKYVAMLDRADKRDHRIRGTLSYHAASTGRWASRGINVQNLPRPAIKSFEEPVQFIRDNDEASLELCYGDKIDALCSLIRCAIIPSEGNSLVVSDYSAIEARVLAWLAGSKSILEVFNTHGKLYEYTATQIYGVDLDKVTKAQRHIGKTAALALGYQGGPSALIRMANAYGIDIPAELAEKIVKKWRAANKDIVNLWYRTQEKAIEAVLSKGDVVKVNHYIAFKFGKFKGRPYLYCRLPSGRLLSYVNPKLVQGMYGNQLTYAGVNSFTRQWERIDTYGGKLVENITQAVARDVLANAKLNVVGTDYDNVVLSVHDELICDVPKDKASSDKLSEIMCDTPDWAKGLPISAEGEVTERYWK